MVEREVEGFDVEEGGDRKGERYVAKDGEKGLLRGAGDMEKDDNLVAGSKVGGFKLEIVV